MRARESVAGQLREQARWCAVLGSPLYAHVLEAAAADVLAGGPAWQVLAGHEDDRPGSVLALRFLGAVHRLVLSGAAPGLAAHYPSAGGTPGPTLVEDFLAAVGTHAGSLRSAVDEPVQTNEPGRSAALLPGFLDVAERFGLPLRLLEIGASAGLNLRFDRYRYVSGEWSWGPPSSPLVLPDVFADGSPLPPRTAVAVASRAGCDPSPVDAASPAGRLRLESFVWPDQAERYARLRAALSVAPEVPVRVDAADAGDWLPPRLATPAAGVATVVFHSVVWQYVAPASRAAVLAALDEAGARASATAPLAYLRFEPGTDDGFEVRLRCWPDGSDVLLATAGPHGTGVRLLRAG